jgi:hypothetical protein
MFRRRFSLFAIFALIVASVPMTLAQQAQERTRWYRIDEAKNVILNLYVFHSDRCSHCQAAMRFLANLEAKYSWLSVVRYETSTQPANVQHYQNMAREIGQNAGQVPAFFFCRRLEIGYTSEATSGRRLEESLLRCREALQRQLRAQAQVAPVPLFLVWFDGVNAPIIQDLEIPEFDDRVEVPFWGSVEAADVSLPLFTVVIAAADSFNPCAFFVLLFLLSLLVHAQSRLRMAVIGGLFVLASAAVYFGFMAAWLNLFLVVGNLSIITIIAGTVAVVVALVNIKDFFLFKKGVSLSIPDSARPGLFQRMTRLVGESRWYAMLAGTVFLAITTNFYELLCTSGFPMIYTRVLTLRDLPLASHYGYLALYNVIYVLPMLAIVAAFITMLGARKLTEYEGRVLKLLSGIMMLELGLLLLIAPDWLTTISAAISMLGIAIALTVGVVAIDRRRASRRETDVSWAKGEKSSGGSCAATSG